MLPLFELNDDLWGNSQGCPLGYSDASSAWVDSSAFYDIRGIGGAPDEGAGYCSSFNIDAWLGSRDGITTDGSPRGIGIKDYSPATVIGNDVIGDGRVRNTRNPDSMAIVANGIFRNDRIGGAKLDAHAVPGYGVIGDGRGGVVADDANIVVADGIPGDGRRSPMKMDTI